MSTLAQKFAAYRQSGAKRKVEAEQAKPMYEQRGFLSNTETRHERAARLVEAKAKGFRLYDDDYFWLDNYNFRPRKWAKEKDRKLKRRAENEHRWISTFTRNIVGGFG